MRRHDETLERGIAPLQGLTVGGALRRSATLFGTLEFVKCQQRGSTFAEIDAEVDRLAASLLAQGLARGDHVAVWLTNCREWILSFLACARIGAVVVPINTRYTAAEAGYILSQSDSRALIMTRSMWGNDYWAMLCEVAPSLKGATASALSAPELPKLSRVIAVGPHAPDCALAFESLCQPGAAGAASTGAVTLAQAEAAVTPDDPLIIVYTSGTTGKPKGAMHNHHVIRQATRVGLMLGLTAGGRALGHLPLYHVAGLYMSFVPALTLGGCYVAMPQWDTATAIDLLERERISCFGGIPTHFVDLANHPSINAERLPELKCAWIGGAPVMQSTFGQFMKALGLDQLMSTYGMTENTISTTFNLPDDPVDVCCRNLAPILGPSEVRIVDPGTGAELGTGAVGEVQCRGETVMIGYYKNPEATRDTITPEGWLRTGDLGVIDDQGYLSITGRLKEMFKTGGSNVYPVEIEQHLARHPAVRIAAVVGIPDDRLGEVGFAFVELLDGARFTLDDLRAHCRGALADYKVPRFVHQVEALPRTSTAKIQRSALAGLAQAELARRRALQTA
jgi:fatty-acyl-CoA synthase